MSSQTASQPAIPPVVCDYDTDCHRPVTHISEDGYICCTAHAERQRMQDISTRRLSATELDTLARGEYVEGA